MNIDIIELLNNYGLPTSLSILFIIFYKTTTDKFNSFLRDSLEKTDVEKEETKEILKEVRNLKMSIEENTISTIELKKTILDYLIGGK